jgi:hypothetical protein
MLRPTHSLRAVWITAAAAIAVLMLAGPAAAAECPNEAVRTGKSARLPDCRAYELVTPAGVQHNMQAAVGSSNGISFLHRDFSPSGDAFAFRSVEGGILPGSNGLFDTYTSARTEVGWKLTRRLSPPGEDINGTILDGSIDPELEYQLSSFNPSVGFEEAGEQAAGGVPGFQIEGNYLSRPGGKIELVGKGSLGIDRHAKAYWISPGGNQIVFQSASHLEPNASPEGVGTVYQRSVDGPTQVVSLLPGNSPPIAGANFEGVSATANAIAFRIFLQDTSGTTELLVRIDGERTVSVATGTGASLKFAGFSESGQFIYYWKEGDIYDFNLISGITTRVTNTGTSEVFFITPDGSHIYFTSTSVIGDEGIGVEGEPNLYVWDRTTGDTTFIATLTANETSAGWFQSLAPGTPNYGALRARSDQSGSELAFVSAAKLTSYENAGHEEIYLYDAESGRLQCASCNPTGSSASGDARFESPFYPLGPVIVSNLTSDGSELFFETEESLVPEDSNSGGDVYEWTERSGPQLISSGEGPGLSYLSAANLVGVSPDGSNVFLTELTPLVPGAPSGVSAIYDARVDGGFPAGTLNGCEGEACQPISNPAVGPSIPGSSALNGVGNLRPPKKGGKRRPAKAVCKKSKRGEDTKGKGRKAGCKRTKKRSSHHRRKGDAK